MNNLPEASISAGRLNKWSAEGMLAKVYLAKSGLGQSGSRNQADLDLAVGRVPLVDEVSR